MRIASTAQQQPQRCLRSSSTTSTTAAAPRAAQAGQPAAAGARRLHRRPAAAAAAAAPERSGHSGRRPCGLASPAALRPAPARPAGAPPQAAMAPPAPEQIASNKCFGGHTRRYRHASPTLGCDMTFSVFFPPAAGDSGGAAAKLPLLYYLSGLTCTDENVIQKAGAQRACAARGVALVAPDTSPRGLGVEGEADSWDFGVGAGFYVNATVDKWRHWRMYDYVTKELPALLAEHFPQLDTSNASITGHSMGGHGALTIALKNPGVYKSVSAFAPICNPSKVPWGIKAFTGYFGEDRKDLWAAHDATELIKSYSGPPLPALIDTGTADQFLAAQLSPEAFRDAAAAANFPVTMRMQEGYDHSYFFMATFIDEHVDFHARALGAKGA